MADIIMSLIAGSSLQVGKLGKFRNARSQGAIRVERVKWKECPTAQNQGTRSLLHTATTNPPPRHAHFSLFLHTYFSHQPQTLKGPFSRGRLHK